MKLKTNMCILTAAATALLATAHPASGASQAAPPPSAEHQMAYDTARQEVVLFGLTLQDGTRSTQTWVWDGRWSLKTPTSSPPGNFNGGMTYDEARQRAVFYGGGVSVSNTNGTWTWDGTNWATMTPTIRPPARYGTAMAYDPVHAVTVLFGGNLRTNISYLANTNDTWLWDGSNWAPKTPANRPSVRTCFGLAFDGARGQTVLFGGLNNYSGGGDFSDTWIWNGTNWIQKSPVFSPPALNVSGMTYDSVRQEVVFFGGLPSSGGNNNTYAWNGTNWSQKAPSVRPSQRFGHAMAFDPARGTAVLFGGVSWPSGTYLGDTWLWDGTNWYSSDVAVTLSASPGPIMVGGNLTYTFVVTNRGPSGAESVALMDDLPQGVGYVSASSSQGSCIYSNGTVTCELGSLAVGPTATVSIVVAPQAPGVVTNQATVICAAELNPSNNVALAQTMVVSPPVIRTQLVNQTISPGGALNLSITADGTQPLFYQWQLNGVDIDGAVFSTLMITNASRGQAGFYSVIVRNAYGSATSSALLSLSELHMYAGITVAGMAGTNYVIYARNSLSTNDPWFALTNFTLSESPYLYIDTESPSHPQRFYQVIVP
jgi:uncharacterized repeat protein (TIGR01451 family)